MENQACSFAWPTSKRLIRLRHTSVDRGCSDCHRSALGSTCFLDYGVKLVGQRLNDARNLRRDLANRGVDTRPLDNAIGQLQRLGSPLTLSDPRAEKELRTQVIEGLRAFEFQLGQAFGEVAPTGRVLVDRSGEIPAEYRKYVEEYYRSLGRTKPR